MQFAKNTSFDGKMMEEIKYKLGLGRQVMKIIIIELGFKLFKEYI